MKLRRFLALLSALSILFTLSACGLDEGEMTMRDIELKEKNFKALGRVLFDDDRIYCALSGTGVEFTFKGTECTVTVNNGNEGSTNPSDIDGHPRIAIYLNGERVVDDMIDAAVKSYPVFTSEDPIEADVKIVKLSESANSTFYISGISVNGTAISPAENKDHLIEFIGDSITCGYGVDDEDMNHHFSTRTEDNTKTYAYKTAELLDADYSMVSFSGYGIISGYSDGSRKVSEQTVQQYYDKYGFSWSSQGYAPSEHKWDFKRKPDVVVINLGTNDNSYCKGIAERCEEYQQEYVNFLKDIRKKNPNATMIGTLGIMGQELYPYVEAAVKQYSEETGDKNVYSMMFDNQSMADGIAADWHPSETTHAKAAQKLSDKISEIMGW